MDDEDFLWQMVEGKVSSYINIECWLQNSTRYHLPACFAMGKSHCIILISAWRPTNDSKSPGVQGTHSLLLVSTLKSKQSHTCPPALSRLLASWTRHGTLCPAVVIIPYYESTRVPLDGRLCQLISRYLRGGCCTPGQPFRHLDGLAIQSSLQNPGLEGDMTGEPLCKQTGR